MDLDYKSMLKTVRDGRREPTVPLDEKNEFNGSRYFPAVSAEVRKQQDVFRQSVFEILEKHRTLGFLETDRKALQEISSMLNTSRPRF